MNLVDPNQLNEFVRPVLQKYLSADYTLSSEGQQKVIEANRKLDDHYARQHNLPVADWCFDDIFEKIVQVKPPSYDRCLDVCAGTGYVSLNIMRKRLFKECVALDLNEEALRILRSRADQMAISGIETVAGNIMETKFPDNHFDCIIGNAFLHHLPDQQTFFREMFRILKPDGVFVATGEPSVAAMRWQHLFPRIIKSFFGKRHWPEEIVLTDIWQFDSKTFSSLMKTSGFREVQTYMSGQWSVALYFFLSGIWMRLLGGQSPDFLLKLTTVLRRQGRRSVGSNEFAILSILARK